MVRLRLAACAALLLGAGCSLFLTTAEPSQCTTDRDCSANAALRDRICEEGFCVVPRAAVNQVSNDAGDGCVTTELCTQHNSGKASVCKKTGGPCTPWQTAQCPTIHGAWNAPNPLVVGVIQPYGVKQANGEIAPIAYAERIERAMKLGLDELTTAAPGGIPTGGGPARPVALLFCDSVFDATLANAAMTHLTDVVGSRTIIAGGDEDLAAIRQQAIDKQVAVVCSDCIAPFPAGPPVAWRIVPALAAEADMAAWRVADLETRILARSNPPSTVKVAVLATPDPGATAFVSALTAKLVFNGKSAVANGASYTVRTTEDPRKDAVNHVAHAEALAAFEPDVLVVAMGAELPARYLQLLESKWTSAKPKPFYLTTALAFELAPFVAPIGADDDLRKRISGTRPAFDPVMQANMDAYTTRYKLAYNYKPPDGNFSGYDAFYAMAYAVAASSTQPLLDGPHVSAGFERLRAGTAIDVGPEDLGLGLALLGTATSTVDLRGLVSNLSWDLATRDLVVPESGMYCFERDASGALVLRNDAGPRLNRVTGVVTGSYACD